MKKTVVVKAHSAVRTVIINLAMFVGVAVSVAALTLSVLVFAMHRNYGAVPFVLSLVGLAIIVVASIFLRREFRSHFHYES